MINRRAILQGALGLINAAMLYGTTSPGAIARELAFEGSPAPIKPDRLLRAQLTLAKGLVGKLGREASAGSNVVVSPASVTSILALLDLGASNQMRSALYRCLGFPVASRATQGDDFEGLRRVAADLTRKSQDKGPLTLANMLVFDPSTRPSRLALLGLAAAGADVAVEDLDKPEAIQKINDWVKGKTKGLIPEVLGEAPGDLGLVAVNALHFKDRWKTPFDPASTAPAKFSSTRSRSSDVAMMHLGHGRYSFRQDDRFVAIELPYAADDFKLVVLTTKTGVASAATLASAWNWLSGGGFSEQSGELALPRFSLSSSAELLEPLDAMGLADARTRRDALNGFSRTPQQIARIVQKTELRVTEEGTEAAAATAVVTLRSVEANYVKMVVDKPFGFALRDQRTGFVLLSGYIASPNTAA
ncbi:MAG: serpin family protein [Bradyrhizobium sp.]|uniref:serpin family protein n=1 Tax=Bradyrhizobium sp. TaxID=376 RepID=UPI003D1213A5